MTKILKLSCLVFLFFALSCEKEPEAAPGNCNDGFLNNGETGIDCGGPCPPCLEPEISSFNAAFNGVLSSFNVFDASYDGTFYLHAKNDSIDLYLRFDNIENPPEGEENWPFLDIGEPILEMNGVTYTEFAPNSFIFLSDNTNNKITGFFQLRLPIGEDTMRVNTGSFYFIPY